ncbi:MAG: response regulator [Myxococcota bacterium]
MTLVIAAAMVAFSGVARARWVAHGAVASLAVLYGSVTILTGALAYIGWLGFVLILGYLLLGHRAGTRWLFATIATAGVAVALLGGAPPGHLSSGDALVRGMRVVSLLPVLAALAWFYELQRSRHITALERSNAAAREASPAKSRMLAHVSHEVRTPLNGLMGLTDLLMSSPLPDDVHRTLGTIQRSGRLLLHIVSDLLDAARTEAGRLELAPRPCDLGELVEETLALHRARAAHKGLALELRTDGARQPVSVDPARFQQIVGNLVANAISYTERGRVTVRLSIAPARAIVTAPVSGLCAVHLAVEDTGVGLSREARQRLFQPFSRPAGGGQGGTGLGLVITRHLVERFGGTLGIDSEPGRGSVFAVAFAAPAATSAEPLASRKVLRPLRGRVLVVDDNEINLKVAEALLRRLGLEVDCVGSGGEALAQLAVSAPDIVFMDLQMPELDGFETTRRRRAGGGRAPIVAVTASELPETEQLCRSAGMNAVIVKPLELERLVTLLGPMLDAARA